GTDDLLSPLCADSQAPDEQRVITGLNGFNKPDNERSAVRQSEVQQVVHEEVQDLEVLHTEGCLPRTRALRP
ncbi:Hypothetical protein SMAX5B_021760, partial [Scophthalmus maximus]